ncbi:MAG TPA: radical SAM protein, partial [Armatimonadota bacterium]|nr:radical SAM protein [Armatimonadota bacterium]
MELDHYVGVRDGQRAPRFVAARSLPVEEGEDLWEAHARGLARLQNSAADPIVASPDPVLRSLLDIKIELADRALDACGLCPHLCRVDRNHGEVGYCGVAAETAVHWEGVLHGEELPLVPSHEIFLSGCTMRCAFCYSHEHITRPMSGQTTQPAELAACIRARRAEGSTNVNLVGGEPTVHLPNILRTLRLLESPVPVVWNSNMYATEEAMALLDGVVDLFLGDIHFGNEGCARCLGRIPDYLPSVTAAFAMAVRSGASVIIRHLVMPGHVECCARPAMDWAAAELPETPFHLMFQYVPDYRAEGDPVLGRVLTPAEVKRCLEHAEQAGVLLYQDSPQNGTRGVDAGARTPHPAEGIGETVDVLVHPDGRISFTRLIGGLL